MGGDSEDRNHRLRAVSYTHLDVYKRQVLCRVAGRPAGEVKRALEAEGGLVRYFDKPGLRDCIRISAGRPEDTDRLLAALKKVEPQITQITSS